MATLDFEKPILDLEHKINDLRQMGSKRVTLEPEIKRLESKLEKLKNDIYNNMTPWQRVQIARHPKRPFTLDYIRMMTDEFLELHGDRLFADDHAMIGGFAKIDGQKVMIIGHQKGRDVKENVLRNFGCAHPEGYRKAMRLMRLAAKFEVPVICLIDTPGAYPGIGAEERGQAQAIAENLRDMAGVKTPIAAVIIGEGGSGGALGIGVADRIFILQHAYYSVISPEGCASILWRSSLKAPLAAEALKLHGEDLIKFNIVDEIIPEPLGGAHREPQEAATHLKAALIKYFKKASSLNSKELLEARYKKYRTIGEFIEKMMPSQDIRDLSLQELTAYLKSVAAEPFRAEQVFQWIYQKGAWGFDAMTNVPKELRDRLKKDFILEGNVIAQKLTSEDGTTKFLFDLHDHEKIESVLIPTQTRTTACISTQAGCKFGCKFCASGIGGWKRNLSCAEIVTQVLHVKEEALKHQRPLSNIVFMGTGEPLDNFVNLMKAIRIINSNKGINIGARHITISTVGVVPKIKELSQEGLQVELAISLHGYDNPSRNVLMPVNKKYPFDELIAACREYVRVTHRQITFEYILIKDVTCTPHAVASLKKAFKGIICKMNLIPYNPVSEFDHKTPSREEMLAFRNSLEDSGVHATIRTPRGKDVNAACGQLRHLQMQ